MGTYARRSPPPSADVARAFVTELLASAGMARWALDATFASRLPDHASARDVAGVRIFDLQTALLARDGGLTESWSHDADFVKVAGLRSVTLH